MNKFTYKWTEEKDKEVAGNLQQHLLMHDLKVKVRHYCVQRMQS